MVSLSTEHGRALNLFLLSFVLSLFPLSEYFLCKPSSFLRENDKTLVKISHYPCDRNDFIKAYHSKYMKRGINLRVAVPENK